MIFRIGVGRSDTVSFHVVERDDTLNLMRLLRTTKSVVAYMPVRAASGHWKYTDCPDWRLLRAKVTTLIAAKMPSLAVKMIYYIHTGVPVSDPVSINICQPYNFVDNNMNGVRGSKFLSIRSTSFQLHK